ncbi:MAG: hypothetical protein KJT03_21370, partial [Verrucomicrobiae bacterium]|nr:hypothetical protein [Verrucomicrobiae bacterium]
MKALIPIFILGLFFSKTGSATIESSTESIQTSRLFQEALRPLGTPTDAENAALARALNSIQEARTQVSPSDYATVELSGLERFLQAYPRSAWRIALYTNLGIESYQRGRFSRALRYWRAAWDGGKASDDRGIKPLVDRALGELARMYARLGMMPEIESLVREAGDRTLTGAPQEMFSSARQGLWQMQHEPEKSFKCGPFALGNILALQDPGNTLHDRILNYPSTVRGTSLAELDRLAKAAGFVAIPIYRRPGTEIPVPSVVHWKLGHFGAIVEKRGTRYLLQDPTFVTRQWIDQSVLDEETSGNFLILNESRDLPQGWLALSETQASQIWGKGDTGGGNGGGCGGNDPSGGG